MNRESEAVHYRSCNLCEASCGLEIRHCDGRVTSLRGDAHDPLSRGYICPKGVALQDVQSDPDRLRHPVKRTPSGWVKVGWPEALDEVAGRLKQIQKAHGPHAVGTYTGNPTAHSHGALLMLGSLFGALATRSRFSATSCDGLPHMLAALQMFGHYGSFPVPDIDRTSYFLCFGANPMVSNGSFMTAPDFKRRLRELHGRNGKLVVFDPRRTETSEVADAHHFVRPGTDSFLLLALVHVIFERKLERLGRAEGLVHGLEELKRSCADFAPEAVERVTGVPANVIRSVAVDFASAASAVAYGRVGIATSRFSSINAWLLYALNVVTGNLSTPGGVMFTVPAIDFIGLSGAFGQRGTFGSWTSRVRGLPEFLGEMPAVCMAEEILTPGEDRIRAMLIHAGNPVLSVPNGKLLDQAFESLEFMVCIDIYLNETTRHADFILPPTGPLERGHFALAMNTLSVRNVAKYSPPLLPKPEGSLHDWQILAALTARLTAESALGKLMSRAKLAVIERLGDEGILDLLLKLGPYGTGLTSVYRLSRWLDRAAVGRGLNRFTRRALDRVVDAIAPLRRVIQYTAYRKGRTGVAIDLALLTRNPHGVDLGPLQPVLESRIFHPDGKVALAPGLFTKNIERLKEHLHRRAPGDGQFLLIGRRHLRSNNSWMHNVPRLVTGRERCRLLIADADAARLGLKEGQEVSVSGRVGAIRIAVTISRDIMPGVVCMPHGWGHDRAGVRLSVATSHSGVSMNDITDDSDVDELTGTAVLNGVPVDIVASATERSRPEELASRG